jgi:hypothetical protein
LAVPLIAILILFALTSRKRRPSNIVGAERSSDFGSHAEELAGLTKQERLSYLLDLAALNDSLLQAYRSSLLSTQAIMLAVAGGFAALVIGVDSQLIAMSISILQLILTGVAISLLWIMMNIIEGRGIDVSFLHEQILNEELALPPEQRFFTIFKCFQRASRSTKNITLTAEQALTRYDVQRAVSLGLGHSRRPLNTWLRWGLLIALVSVDVVTLLVWRLKVYAKP